MTKRTKIGLGIFGLLAVIIVFAIVFAPQKGPELRTTIVEYGDVTQSIDVVGTVRKPQTLELAFLSSGRVAEMNVEVGDYVKKGEVLAKLEEVTTTFMGWSETTQDVLTAPMNGIVTLVTVDAGEVAMGGSPIVVLESPEDVFVIDVQIPESDVTKLADKPYDSVITLDALSDDVTFDGQLIDMDPAAAATQGATFYMGHVMLGGRTSDGKSDLGDIRTGMSADVSIVTSQSSDVLSVPSRAIIEYDGRKYVRVVTNETEGLYEQREVTTGLRGDNGDVVIRSGLTEGDVVVLEVIE